MDGSVYMSIYRNNRHLYYQTEFECSYSFRETRIEWISRELIFRFVISIVCNIQILGTHYTCCLTIITLTTPADSVVPDTADELTLYVSFITCQQQLIILFPIFQPHCPYCWLFIFNLVFVLLQYLSTSVDPFVLDASASLLSFLPCQHQLLVLSPIPLTHHLRCCLSFLMSSLHVLVASCHQPTLEDNKMTIILSMTTCVCESQMLPQATRGWQQKFNVLYFTSLHFISHHQTPRLVGLLWGC